MASSANSSWFVLRFPSQDLSKIQDHLNQSGVSHFAPFTYAEDLGKVKRVPVLPGHIFVQGPQSALDVTKSEYDGEKLRYVMDNQTGKPLSFDDKLMASFKQVAERLHDGVEYLDSKREINVKHGPMVQVVADGPFKGVVGEYLRVRSNRCVVVRLGGLVTVATGFIKPDGVREL